jgi:hypothetical protein
MGSILVPALFCGDDFSSGKESFRLGSYWIPISDRTNVPVGCIELRDEQAPHRPATYPVLGIYPRIYDRPGVVFHDDLSTGYLYCQTAGA